MSIFLGLCFVFLTMALFEVKFDPKVPRALTIPYILGLVLLDILTLAMTVAVWAVEQGRL